MASDIDLIWVKREAVYFCNPDWTGQIRLIRLNNRRFSVERKMAVCGDAIQMRAMIQSRRERIQEQTNRQEWLL
jgi:hypothetical protein